MRTYRQTKEELEEILEKETLEEVIDFCNTALIAATIGQYVFKKRFPKEYEIWDKNIADEV